MVNFFWQPIIFAFVVTPEVTDKKNKKPRLLGSFSQQIECVMWPRLAPKILTINSEFILTRLQERERRRISLQIQRKVAAQLPPHPPWLPGPFPAEL
jgi:hypothetical protein